MFYTYPPKGGHEARDLPVVLAVHIGIVYHQQPNHIKMTTWNHPPDVKHNYNSTTYTQLPTPEQPQILEITKQLSTPPPIKLKTWKMGAVWAELMTTSKYISPPYSHIKVCCSTLFPTSKPCQCWRPAALTCHMYAGETTAVLVESLSWNWKFINIPHNSHIPILVTSIVSYHWQRAKEGNFPSCSWHLHRPRVSKWALRTCSDPCRLRWSEQCPLNLEREQHLHQHPGGRVT